MKNYIYTILIAFFGGVCGFSTLYVLFFLSNYLVFIFLPPVFLWIFSFLLFNSFVEEGTKFLLIKKWEIGKFPYGFFLGLGWGGTENFMHYLAKDVELNSISSSMVIGLHIITAGVICYFIKKNKPISGLLIAITIHTGFNLFIRYVV